LSPFDGKFTGMLVLDLLSPAHCQRRHKQNTIYTMSASPTLLLMATTANIPTIAVKVTIPLKTTRLNDYS